MGRMGFLALWMPIFLLAAGCGGGGDDDDDGPDPNALVFIADAARTGGFGMRTSGAVEPLVLFDTVAGVQDDSPATLTPYTASFWIRMDGIVLGAGERVEVFKGLSFNQTTVFTVFVEGDGTGIRLTLSARVSGGLTTETPPGSQAVVPPGYQQITVSFASAAGTGSVLASVGGGAQSGLMNLDNDLAGIQSVQLGALGGDLNPGSGGFIDFDDFASTDFSDGFETGDESAWARRVP